jgi:hypothetical protein
MPYIVGERRTPEPAENVGDLTFDIQQLLLDYLVQFRLKYQTISEIKAALVGAYDDFQQRIVVPYEEDKCDANGDVWVYWEDYL